jgi:hypothetical protein
LLFQAHLILASIGRFWPSINSKTRCGKPERACDSSAP